MANIYKLISVQNAVEIPNRKSRKNKNRAFYHWTLERVIGVREVDFIMEGFPSSSIDTGIQKVKEDIINQLNEGNIFDFDFSPKEKDYLSIVNNANRDEYLNLIFMENSWKEEQFLFSLKDANRDEYEMIHKGVFEL